MLSGGTKLADRGERTLGQQVGAFGVFEARHRLHLFGDLRELVLPSSWFLLIESAIRTDARGPVVAESRRPSLVRSQYDLRNDDGVLRGGGLRDE